MRTRLWFSPAVVVILLCLGPSLAAAQRTGLPPVQVVAGGGFLTSGAYLTGPGALALRNGDALDAKPSLAAPSAAA